MAFALPRSLLEGMERPRRFDWGAPQTTLRAAADAEIEHLEIQ